MKVYLNKGYFSNYEILSQIWGVTKEYQYIILFVKKLIHLFKKKLLFE